MRGSKVELFSQAGELVAKDVSPWQTFSGKGMRFWLESYDWNRCACVSHLSMRAFFGLMKMDTIICTPYAKDLPILSYDFISALGRNTLLLEVYDTQVQPTDLSALEAVKANYQHLKDKPTKPAWYDSLKLPPTLCKTGQQAHLSGLTTEMIQTYLVLFASAREVDRAAKTARNSAFAEGLIKDGPAFRAVSKMLGVDSAKLLFRKFIFGTI